MRVIVKHRVPFIVATEFYPTVHFLAVSKHNIVRVVLLHFAVDEDSHAGKMNYYLAFEKIGDAIYIGGKEWIYKITLVDG